MNMKEVYEKQREFEDLVIGKSKGWPSKPLSEFTEEEQVTYTKELILYLIKETTELLDAVGNFKMHKTKRDNPNYKEIPEEIADCLIFVLNLALTHGLTYEQLIEVVKMKQDKNFKRQEEGY